MKIYLSHSSNYDFKKELYEPILEVISKTKHSVFLPELNKTIKTKDIIKESNLFIMECSRASTGMGIECGWADAFNIPVVVIYQKGFVPSNSVKYLTNKIYEYRDTNDLKKLMENILS